MVTPNLVLDIIRDFSVVTLDTSGKVVSWNSGAEVMSGYKAEEVIGQHYSVFYTNEDQKKDRPNLDFAVAMQGGRFEDRQWRMKKNGTRFWANIVLCPLYEEGMHSGFVCVVRDISEEKKREEELKNSFAQLEEFSYVVSHDLQEPLRMVSTYVALLSKKYKDKLGEDAEQFLKYAEEGSIRAQRLIREILEYSRIGRKGREFEKTNLEPIIKLALDNLQLAVKDNQAEITFDSLPDVHVDRVQIGQLFQNLIQNALKYRSEGTPKIHISAETGDEEVVVSVRDNGIGIEPRFFEKIFGIFQRLHLRKEYSGTGIGLALCKRIVERHGGKIWVESVPGEGSTFKFSIPHKFL